MSVGMKGVFMTWKGMIYYRRQGVDIDEYWVNWLWDDWSVFIGATE